MEELRKKFIRDTQYNSYRRRRPYGGFDKFEKGFLSYTELEKYKKEHSIKYNEVLKFIK